MHLYTSGLLPISGLPRAKGLEYMNCLLEVMATVWMTARRQVMTEPVVEEVASAHEGLEQCRRNMEGRERELQTHIERLTAEALVKKREGDVSQARARLQERRRCTKRLERLRHGIDLVDSQIDAIKTSELDKEIMLTLKASSSAMRKAGINLGVQEVENVMSEIDEQMREVQDITDVLSNPLVTGGGGLATGAGDEADLDEELELLEETAGKAATAAHGQSAAAVVPGATNSMRPLEPPLVSTTAVPGGDPQPWQPRAVGEALAVV